MNNQPLPLKDWENLSAYLDGQLSKQEQAHLETRVQQQPELQRALAELRQTKTMIHQVSRKRVPHNFTLSPAMAPRPRSWLRLIPSLSIASAVATLLLIVSFVFEFLPGLQPTQMLYAPAAPVADQQIATEVARQMAAATAPTNESAPIVIWNNVGGMGGGPGADATAGISAAPPPDKSSNDLVAPMPTAPPLVETPAPTAPAAQSAVVPPRASSQTSSAPTILGIRPSAEQGKVADNLANQQSPTFALTPTSSGPSGLGDLRGTQVLLVLLALGTGLAALVLSRRNR